MVMYFHGFSHSVLTVFLGCCLGIFFKFLPHRRAVLYSEVCSLISPEVQEATQVLEDMSEACLVCGAFKLARRERSVEALETKTALRPAGKETNYNHDVAGTMV
jgi:hypothetical protein